MTNLPTLALATCLLGLVMLDSDAARRDGGDTRQRSAPTGGAGGPGSPGSAPDTVIHLPDPSPPGGVTVEDALRARRSVRTYGARPLRTAELSRLLWAAQGLTGGEGRRTAPSAGALYPLVLYVVAGDVGALAAGVYRYAPAGHSLIRTASGDVREALARAALGQGWVADAPVVLVLAALPDRTTGKYGRRGVRYVHMEVGHAAQNVYLQAEALDLGTVMVGAFRDGEVAGVVGLSPGEVPLGIMPVGPAPGGPRR